METSSVTSATASATTPQRNSAKELENQFLTLLVAQLKNQDPTNPVQNEEFITQLAQLETLDQQQKLAATNQSLLLQSSLATGASLIGGQVEGHVILGGSQQTVTGLVTSLRVENNEVVLRVEQEGGTIVSMPAQNIISVAPASLAQDL
jgi:flagellar basal-body rod modification protein FlgD